MKTFYEWLDNQHPEYLNNEGILDYMGRKGGLARDTMTKFVLPATAALGMGMAFNNKENPSSQNRPAAIQRVDPTSNEDFIAYAAQQVERQLGGSQHARLPEPKGWKDLGEDTQDKIYSIVLDALIKQYGAKDQEDLQRMFDRDTIAQIKRGADVSNYYKINP